MKQSVASICCPMVWFRYTVLSIGHAAIANTETISEIEKHLKIYSWGASSQKQKP